MSSAIAFKSKVWNGLLDIVYPPRCGGCDRRGEWFCADCRLSIAPPSEAGHSILGVHGLVCAGEFDGPLRQAIHNLKYENDTPLAAPLAGLLHIALKHSPYSQDLEQLAPSIVPVPLHKDKQRDRGYNQSMLLAKELAAHTSWLTESSLQRVRSTRSQVGLTAQERGENVRDAFVWVGEETEVPHAVLLVDDVFTTGSTLGECVLVLRNVGVKRIYIATVARAKGL